MLSLLPPPQGSLALPAQGALQSDSATLAAVAAMLLPQSDYSSISHPTNAQLRSGPRTAFMEVFQPGILQSLARAVGYAGLDRHQRVIGVSPGRQRPPNVAIRSC